MDARRSHMAELSDKSGGEELGVRLTLLVCSPRSTSPPWTRRWDARPVSCWDDLECATWSTQHSFYLPKMEIYC